MGGSQSRGEREVTVEQREDGGQPRIVVSWNAARPKTSDDPSHLTVNAFNSYIFLHYWYVPDLLRTCTYLAACVTPGDARFSAIRARTAAAGRKGEGARQIT